MSLKEISNFIWRVYINFHTLQHCFRWVAAHRATRSKRFIILSGHTMHVYQPPCEHPCTWMNNFNLYDENNWSVATAMHNALDTNEWSSRLFSSTQIRFLWHKRWKSIRHTPNAQTFIAIGNKYRWYKIWIDTLNLLAFKSIVFTTIHLNILSELSQNRHEFITLISDKLNLFLLYF